MSSASWKRAATDISLNTIGKYIKLSDNVPPEAMSVVVYPQSAKSSVAGNDSKTMVSLPKSTTGKYNLSSPIYAKGKIGIGVEYCDRMNGSSNRYGAERADLIVNGKTVYTSVFDKVD